MSLNITKLLDKIRCHIPQFYALLRNKNHSFTIISNDCWTAEVYIDNNIQCILCGFIAYGTLSN